MHFNVSQLLMDTSGSSRTFDVDEKLAAIGGAARQPVKGTVRLVRTDKGVWVSAELDSEVTAMCSRCLRSFDQILGVSIEEEFFPLHDVEIIAGLTNRHDIDESYGIDDDHILDLTEAVRQYTELGEPMKLLCTPGCKGLCGQCGVDLNETSCRCYSTVMDSRWGPLLELATMDGPAAGE